MSQMVKQKGALIELDFLIIQTTELSIDAVSVSKDYHLYRPLRNTSSSVIYINRAANNLQEPGVDNGAINGHNPPPMNTFGQGQHGNLGGASSSSRGHAYYAKNGGGFGPANKNVPSCCHDLEFSCGGDGWGGEKAQRPLLPPSRVPTAAAWVAGFN
ncbi:hypothetical protein OIU84_020914 [Salix udensis]|uniref:Uncharacterized protein n=1 Tax=Salix udensis TaxID=889485 RepID=A0AAD6KTV4_9ROSI|nr:hypothetical protein OIU84_020914 [Salix udensis]